MKDSDSIVTRQSATTCSPVLITRASDNRRRSAPRRTAFNAMTPVASRYHSVSLPARRRGISVAALDKVSYQSLAEPRGSLFVRVARHVRVSFGGGARGRRLAHDAVGGRLWVHVCRRHRAVLPTKATTSPTCFFASASLSLSSLFRPRCDANAADRIFFWLLRRPWHLFWRTPFAVLCSFRCYSTVDSTVEGKKRVPWTRSVLRRMPPIRVGGA